MTMRVYIAHLNSHPNDMIAFKEFIRLANDYNIVRNSGCLIGNNANFEDMELFYSEFNPEQTDESKIAEGVCLLAINCVILSISRLSFSVKCKCGSGGKIFPCRFCKREFCRVAFYGYQAVNRISGGICGRKCQTFVG